MVNWILFYKNNFKNFVDKLQLPKLIKLYKSQIKILEYSKLNKSYSNKINSIYEFII